MSDYKIPEKEQDNFVSVYWQMLIELQGKCDPDKDILDKHMIDGAYRLLNRCKIFHNIVKPRWDREERRD